MSSVKKIERYFLDMEFHEYGKPFYFMERNFDGKGTFHGVRDNVPTIDPISIGIVNESGKKLYCICKDFDIDFAWANHWLRENVLKDIFATLLKLQSMDDKIGSGEFTFENFQNLLKTYGQTRDEIRIQLIDYLQLADENIDRQFYGYYCDYDWVCFCWFFGKMIDLPSGMPMYCRDLKQTLDETAEEFGLTLEDVKADEKYPKQKNEHNAFADAEWNFELYQFLKELKEWGA